MTSIHEYLAEQKRLAEAATEGPWAVNSETCGSEFGDYTVHGIKGVAEATWATDDSPAFAHCEGMEEVDAEFIAAARSSVPRLVAALEAVTEVHRPDPMANEWCVCEERVPCSTVSAIEAALGGEGT